MGGGWIMEKVEVTERTSKRVCVRVFLPARTVQTRLSIVVKIFWRVCLKVNNHLSIIDIDTSVADFWCRFSYFWQYWDQHDMSMVIPDPDIPLCVEVTTYNQPSGIKLNEESKYFIR